MEGQNDLVKFVQISKKKLNFGWKLKSFWVLIYCQLCSDAEGLFIQPSNVGKVSPKPFHCFSDRKFC